LAVNRKMREESLHLRRRHLQWMPLSVEQDEAADPE
jgi:hypothetical protein